MNTNVVVAQSGGPSPVINASLQGVIDACRANPETFGRVFAGYHGIEGILQEQLIDLDAESPEELARLRDTPGAGAVGTCRYKLHYENHDDFERVIDVFQAHQVGYFFYIGGNDSMDTAAKVADLAHERGIDLRVVGVPKTIDNDVGDPEFAKMDHTPGYGSAARYWAYITQILEEENRGMSSSEPVCVAQAMGRSSGFIPAAARLADPDRKLPLHIYLAESHLGLEELAERVNGQVKRSGRCIVIVSEGFNVGGLGELHDAFGHIEYGASKSTVAQKVTNYLNEHGLPVRGNATGQVPGALQRSTSIFASSVDREEAYEVGCHAVELAVAGRSGVMATITRAGGVPWAQPGTPAPLPGSALATYRPVSGEVALEEVANFHRQLPAHWLDPEEPDVTDHFVAYARPLIGSDWPRGEVESGRQRFAKLRIRLLDRKLPAYVPVNHRG